MGMNLGINRVVFAPNENQEWLGSEEGTDNADSITLDSTAIRAAFGALGYVPSGVVLGKVTATGKYVPYADANTDGSQTALGLLLTTVDLSTLYRPAGDISAALYWGPGEVIAAKLPANNGLDAAAQADLKLIRFV